MARRKNRATLAPPEDRRSIYVEAEQHAYAHKWIESEKAHRDLGEAAFIDWYRRYWWTFCRERLIEHLLGTIFWQELDDNNFGLIARRFAKDDDLIAAIVDILKRGGENLDVVQYALENNLSMDEVLLRLEIFDINAARIVPNMAISETQFVSKISETRRLSGLVVDPDEQMRHWLRQHLLTKEISTYEAESMHAALKEAVKRHFDIFFIELDLPDSYGTELADNLYRHGCASPIIAITSRAEEWNRDDVIDCGFTELLIKPIPSEAVAAILEKLRNHQENAAN